MASESKGAILVGEALASQTCSSDGNAAQTVRSPKIPLAISSDDLNELTAALASYLERRNFAVASD